jgi:anaerobic selenocysteine-containing dehydrogenase
MMHPTDAARDGLADGGWVKVGNARGEVSLRLECFDGLQPGVVICESLWPNDAFPEGLGVNVLTGADPAGPAGGAAFHDNSVWVRRA